MLRSISSRRLFLPLKVFSMHGLIIRSKQIVAVLKDIANSGHPVRRVIDMSPMPTPRAVKMIKLDAFL